MKKYLKWIIPALIVIFAALQFFNPSHANPPVVVDFIATNSPPPQIAAMLHAACYDCHSHETRWPWYSRVAPVSWLIANDVNEGRDNLDLSDWPADDLMRCAKKMGDMSEQIGFGDMPMKKYTVIHANARLTEAEKKQLMDWLDAHAAQLKALAETK